jgi:hypothetical protein
MDRIIRVSAILSIFFLGVKAQNNLPNQDIKPQKVNPLEKGLSFNLSEDGKYSIKFGASSEIWMRYCQLNPGTKNFDGKFLDNDFDFVLRRVLSNTSVKMDRFLFFTMMGLGTQTINSSVSPYTATKPTFFLYDAWGSYSIVPEYLKIGYGLNLYRGLSRYTSATATKTIGADVPMLSAPDVVTSDQIARHLGFFAAGNIKMFNYRINFGKPFVVDNSNRPDYGKGKASDVPNNNYSTEGYFAIQFFDREISPMPFTTGTYLGKKKMFNIGFGYIFHPKSTKSITENGDTVAHNKLHLAVDIFADIPMTNGGNLTYYAAFYKYDYGPNYLLNGGTANVYSKTGGISEPGFGTGNAVSMQIAWLFPHIFGDFGRVQVYYEGDYRFYDALQDVAIHQNIGLTYFELSHNLKFTIQYELRPYFKSVSFDSYKSLLILKSQFFF